MVLIKTIKTYINDFLGLIYPELCVTCESNLYQQERILCTKCLYHLPRTHFHKVPSNPVEQTFWGRVPIERATSYFFFQKGSKYQKLLHQLKYQNRPDIGIELGRIMAADIINEPNFSTIDFIIPVPLHPKKQYRRGYNQSELIGKGIQEILNAELKVNMLYRKTFTDTQTRKSRYERWENVEDVFGVHHADQLEGKHVLLVDDVLTTGATIEGCAQVLHKSANLKISVATLAYANI